MELFDKAWDKAKKIKNQYDEHMRAEKEDALNVKADELGAKEAQLRKLEDDLKKQSLALETREREVVRKAKRPLYVLALSVATIILIQVYLWTNYDITAKPTPTLSKAPVAAASTTPKIDVVPLVPRIESAPRESSPPSSAISSVSSSSQSMSFEECQGVIQRVATEVGTAPINIVETDIMRSVRFRTTDGAVLVTCSRPDHKMVITKSPYQ